MQHDVMIPQQPQTPPRPLCPPQAQVSMKVAEGSGQLCPGPRACCLQETGKGWARDGAIALPQAMLPLLMTRRSCSLPRSECSDGMKGPTQSQWTALLMPEPSLKKMIHVSKWSVSPKLFLQFNVDVLRFNMFIGYILKGRLFSHGRQQSRT